MPRKNANALRGTGTQRIVMHKKRCGCSPCRTKRQINSGALPRPAKGVRATDPGWKTRRAA